jgi:hypothetical protein
MFKRASLIICVLFTAAVLPTGACSEVDETVDCGAFCDKYKTCLDDSVSVIECTDTCEDWADQSDANADRVDSCHACINDHACLQATASCVDECAFIPVRP